MLTQGVPATFFLNEKFAQRNAAAVQRLATLPQLRFENHSKNHVLHMETLSAAEIRKDVLANHALLHQLTGRAPRFFRFPGGNHDAASLAVVEGLGYRVVHWTFASGDPDQRLTPARLTAQVLRQVRPGSILIFHINGRGYATGQALPAILQGLRDRGYRFMSLDEALGP